MNKIPVLIATRNAHKAKEIARILPAPYEVHTMAEYPDIPDPVENGTTFAANAAIKAESVSARVPGLVVADDSGICVDLLNGAPGVMSARFCGEHGKDDENNRKLLRELAALPGQAPYKAHYACAISLAEGGRRLPPSSAPWRGRLPSIPPVPAASGMTPLHPGRLQLHHGPAHPGAEGFHLPPRPRPAEARPIPGWMGALTICLQCVVHEIGPPERPVSYQKSMDFAILATPSEA